MQSTALKDCRLYLRPPDCLHHIRTPSVVIFLASWSKFIEYFWNIFYFACICHTGMNLLMETVYFLSFTSTNFSAVCVVFLECISIQIGRCERCMQEEPSTIHGSHFSYHLIYITRQAVDIG